MLLHSIAAVYCFDALAPTTFDISCPRGNSSGEKETGESWRAFLVLSVCLCVVE